MAAPPHEQSFMDNWIFIARYMSVFVGATSLHEGATGYNRRINEDYSHKIWAGVYDDSFRKLKEDHEREVEWHEEYRRHHDGLRSTSRFQPFDRGSGRFRKARRLTLAFFLDIG